MRILVGVLADYPGLTWGEAVEYLKEAGGWWLAHYVLGHTGKAILSDKCADGRPVLTGRCEGEGYGFGSY
jgi:hypothetical protein